MSQREMIRRDLDFMPDDVISVFSTIWSFKKENLDIPNADTIACYEACKNGDSTEYDSVDDFLKAVEEMEDL
jgi:hypothetical protein